MTWLYNVAVAADTFWNVVFRGRLGETISGRAYTAWQAGRRWGCVLCQVLDWIRKDHCRLAHLADQTRLSSA